MEAEQQMVIAIIHHDVLSNHLPVNVLQTVIMAAELQPEIMRAHPDVFSSSLPVNVL
jgi:hypothetical protein